MSNTFIDTLKAVFVQSGPTDVHSMTLIVSLEGS